MYYANLPLLLVDVKAEAGPISPLETATKGFIVTRSPKIWTCAFYSVHLGPRADKGFLLIDIDIRYDKNH